MLLIHFDASFMSFNMFVNSFVLSLCSCIFVRVLSIRVLRCSLVMLLMSTSRSARRVESIVEVSDMAFFTKKAYILLDDATSGDTCTAASSPLVVPTSFAAVFVFFGDVFFPDSFAFVFLDGVGVVGTLSLCLG